MCCSKGAASFVKKTVFGVSDSVTKITSSVGKGQFDDNELMCIRRMLIHFKASPLLLLILNIRLGVV